MKLELEELKDNRQVQAEIHEQELEERSEILEQIDPVVQVTENLTKEEMAILKTLMSKMRA